MSVRTEPRELSAQLQQTLTIPAEVMAAQNPQMMAAMAQGQTAASIFNKNFFFQVKRS